MIKKCKICSKEFVTKMSHIKMGWGKFCSNKCHHLSMKIGKILHCHECNKDIYRNPTKLKVSKSGKFFCTKSCQTKWRNKYFSGDKHAGWIHGQSVYRTVLKRSTGKKLCHRCKKDDTRILVVHHIDHDRKNNNISNLMWLCHNCHFLIHHDILEEKKLMVPMV